MNNNSEVASSRWRHEPRCLHCASAFFYLSPADAISRPRALPTRRNFRDWLSHFDTVIHRAVFCRKPLALSRIAADSALVKIPKINCNSAKNGNTSHIKDDALLREFQVIIISCNYYIQHVLVHYMAIKIVILIIIIMRYLPRLFQYYFCRCIIIQSVYYLKRKVLGESFYLKKKITRSCN